MFPDIYGQDNNQVTPPEAVEEKSLALVRKASSPGNALLSPRLSLSSGITKKKKSRGPLPEIRVDPNDPKAMKKSRNTMAARKSRTKKFEKLKALQELCLLWRERAHALGYDVVNEEEDAKLREALS